VLVLLDDERRYWYFPNTLEHADFRLDDVVFVLRRADGALEGRSSYHPWDTEASNGCVCQVGRVSTTDHTPLGIYYYVRFPYRHGHWHWSGALAAASPDELPAHKPGSELPDWVRPGAAVRWYEPGTRIHGSQGTITRVPEDRAEAQVCWSDTPRTPDTYPSTMFGSQGHVVSAAEWGLLQGLDHAAEKLR